MSHDFDLVTIGAGSGGVAATRRAAALGAKCAIVEARGVGGTCVLRGCVPKKLLAYAASFGEAFDDAVGFGWTVEARRHDWAELVARKNHEIARLGAVYVKNLERSGVEIVRGRATLEDAHTVDVGGRRLTARHVLVATGARPHVPTDVPGHERFVTSDDALDFPRLPLRLVVLGAGYIGVELASIFHGLGSAVTLLARSANVLPAFDDDVRAALADALAKRGVAVRTSTTVTRLEPRGDACIIHTSAGAPIEADAVLAATGRWPNSAGLGLERLGVHLDARGAIPVDAASRTAIDGIWAIGDVTGRLALTPVAIAEGRAFAETAFGTPPPPIDYVHVPTAVFSSPPVGCVGLTEARARERGFDVAVYKTSFRPMKHALSGRDERTMMKLVVDAGSDRVLGCHMVGADAPEIAQAVAIAVVCGATKAQLDRTVALHPTTAEELVLLRERIR
jgi:glutathione reductase (NADPH)